MAEDGLNSLSFKLLRRGRIVIEDLAGPPITHYLVDIGTPEG